MVLLQVSQLFLFLDWLTPQEDLNLTRPLSSHPRKRFGQQANKQKPLMKTQVQMLFSYLEEKLFPPEKFQTFLSPHVNPCQKCPRN